jgi:hypothetical protein
VKHCGECTGLSSSSILAVAKSSTEIRVSPFASQ